MRKVLPLLAVTLLMLSGCSSLASDYPDIKKGVAVAQATLASAEHTALVYAALPSCNVSKAILCRDPAKTASIAFYDNLAFDAVQAADTAQDQTTLQAALTALTELTNITDKLATPLSQPKAADAAAKATAQ